MPHTPEQVQQILEQFVADGPEIGLQVAAYLDGELVVDAWAGHLDPGSAQDRVDGQTLFSASSTGQGPGRELHPPARRTRPAGLRGARVHVLARVRRQRQNATSPCATCCRTQAGVPYPPEGFDTAMMIDWDRMCAGIAELPLQFEPGTRTAYHNYTFGYHRRRARAADRRSAAAQFLQEEVCRPQGVDSLFFGVPATRAGARGHARARQRLQPPRGAAGVHPVERHDHQRPLAGAPLRHCCRRAWLCQLLSAERIAPRPSCRPTRWTRSITSASNAVWAIVWATTPGRAPDRGRSAMSARRCSATPILSASSPSAFVKNYIDSTVRLGGCPRRLREHRKGH